MTTKHSWHQTYEPGVPANIDKKKIVPLVDYLRHTATGHGKSPAFTNFGATVDFNLLEEQSRVMSAGLQSLGLQPIDRVAVMLPNVIQFPVALFGILRSGMTVVNVNPLYTPRELRHQLVDSGATAIIILENFAHVLEQVIADTGVQHVIVTRVGDHMSWAKAALLNNVLKYIKKWCRRGTSLAHTATNPFWRNIRRLNSRTTTTNWKTSPFCNTPAVQPDCPKGPS